MPAYTTHIFICGNQRKSGHKRGSCDPDGKEELRDRFKDELKRANAGPLVRANGAGCLDQCEYGPVVVIYPQQIWYGRVRLKDVRRIVEETIIGRRILEDLLIPNQCLNTKGAVCWPEPVKSK